MKRNYNYAKLIDNKLEYAPNILVIGNEQIINAPAETYKAQGYLPIERTEQPEAEEGFYYSPIYVEDNNKIIQQWEKVEYFVDDVIEKAAAYDVLMGVSE